MAGRAEKYLPPMLKGYTEKTMAWLHNNLDGPWEHNEPGVDYFLALSGVQIEVKNTDKTGALTDKITPRQSKQLDAYGGFIFLVMWEKDYPNLPGGADAYLVPWKVYKAFWDNKPARKAYRRRVTAYAVGVEDVLGQYKLPWAGGTWKIPKNHPSLFWTEVSSRIDLARSLTRMYLDSLED